MKKILLTATLSILGLAMVGCGQTTNNEVESSSQSVNSSTVEEVEYKGIVEEDGSKEEEQVILSSLKQTEKSDKPISFNEVILLTGGVPILDEKTQEKRLVEDIKAGTTITVFLEPNAITTMSLPPQIPGNSIVKILITE